MLEIFVDESGTLLKERDYIGLSQPSSGASKTIASSQVDEDVLEGTELRLELGLGLSTVYPKDEEGEDRELQKSKQLHGSPPCGTGSTASKKWMKRVFSETMLVLKGADQDAALSKQSSIVPFWASSDLEGPAAGSVGLNVTSSRTHMKRNVHTSQEVGENLTVDDTPPAKDRVVGWPPVRSYRRQALTKPAEMFVKVNMDGITVGRKIDLNSYTSYESLLSALEEMFQPSTCVSQVMPGREYELKHFLLAKDSDFVLTYEDKDGDWMLVGDVPWSVFLTMVKRLHITRGSEATGSGTRLLETYRLHG